MPDDVEAHMCDRGSCALRHCGRAGHTYDRHAGTGASDSGANAQAGAFASEPGLFAGQDFRLPRRN